jgi:hypothetical protein
MGNNPSNNRIGRDAIPKEPPKGIYLRSEIEPSKEAVASMLNELASVVTPKQRKVVDRVRDRIARETD